MLEALGKKADREDDCTEAQRFPDALQLAWEWPSRKGLLACLGRLGSVRCVARASAMPGFRRFDVAAGACRNMSIA